jgi:hypothetical protein
MAGLKDQLGRLKARVLAQNGTVLDSVHGEVELDDKDDKGRPLKGPVLILHSIEEGAQLKLAHPRAVIVLGSLSGQVFGAYRVKAGNLLSGRLEGVRHVEIIRDMGSKESTNVDSWIVFEATSDPGFFNQAQQGLERLRQLERYQKPQREATAQQILMRSLKDVPYDIKIFISRNQKLKTVFSIHRGQKGKGIKMDLTALLRYLIPKAEKQRIANKEKDLVEHFGLVLQETVAESLRLANSSGIGAALRKTRGAELYQHQVEMLCDYLQPKLLQRWLKISESLMQRMIDRLSEAPMILQVDGQLSPFFQIEYPRWKFHVVGGKIVPEKIADCNIACQLGSDQEKMSVTYNYVGGEDWISQTQEIELNKTKTCKLILKNGSVYLTEETQCLFGPELEKTKEIASVEAA